jgi:hypothetical protein
MTWTTGGGGTAAAGFLQAVPREAASKVTDTSGTKRERPAPEAGLIGF